MKKITVFIIFIGMIQFELHAFECAMPDQADPDCSIAGEDDFPPYGPALRKRCTGTWW